MKIVHLTDHYQPWLGYQETYLPLEQQRLGHDVQVITSNRYTFDAGSISGRRITNTGVSVEDGVTVTRLPVLLETPTNAGYVVFRGLLKTLRKLAPEIVHCHGFLSITSLQAAMYKRKVGYKLLLDNHNSFYNLYKQNTPGYIKHLKHIIYRINAVTYGQFILANADSIVAIGKPEKDFLQWTFGKSCPEVPIIRLGADKRRFRLDSEQRKIIRQEFGWTDEKIVVIGHAGTLRPTKRLDLMLQSCAGLSNYRDRLRLLFIGSITGTFQSELEKLAGELGLTDQVQFTGHISIEELPRYLSALDIAVWAGDISVTAIEAMAIGLPIIAVRTPYTEDIIENHKAGLLFPGDDPLALMSSLEQIIANPSLRLNMSDNARQAVEKELNWESIAAQFIDLYARM